MIYLPPPDPRNRAHRSPTTIFTLFVDFDSCTREPLKVHNNWCNHIYVMQLNWIITTIIICFLIDLIGSVIWFYTSWYPPELQVLLLPEQIDRIVRVHNQLTCFVIKLANDGRLVKIRKRSLQRVDNPLWQQTKEIYIKYST